MGLLRRLLKPPRNDILDGVEPAPNSSHSLQINSVRCRLTMIFLDWLPRRFGAVNLTAMALARTEGRMFPAIGGSPPRRIRPLADASAENRVAPRLFLILFSSFVN